MEFPANAEHPLRVETLAPPLVAVLIVSIFQPLIVIVTTILPFRIGEPAWRYQVFALLLGAAPQVSVGLVFLAAIGLFARRYGAVRGASIGALTTGVLLLPVLVLDGLDFLQVRRMVPGERLHGFDLNAMQAIGLGAILAPLLLWLGWRGLQAGKKPLRMDIEDHLLVGSEQAAPETLDPRVTN